MTRIMPPENIPSEIDWESRAHDAPCESGVMAKPCADCAIETGFYLEIAEDLAKQPKHIQEKAARSWFCHNNGKYSCAGLAHYLERFE